MSADAQVTPAGVLDGTTRGLGLMLAGMAAFATWDQWAIWSTKDDYGFGYLVPAFSAYVLWDRWDELRALLTGERSHVSAPASRAGLLGVQTLAFLAVACFGLGAGARAVFGTGVGPTLGDIAPDTTVNTAPDTALDIAHDIAPDIADTPVALKLFKRHQL